jgi:hypothetical protein
MKMGLNVLDSKYGFVSSGAEVVKTGLTAVEHSALAMFNIVVASLPVEVSAIASGWLSPWFHTETQKMADHSVEDESSSSNQDSAPDHMDL